ncbi:MAG: tyrosine-protein phosphatase, partial [Acidobacteriota bacterium]|nr:tyrosine-protein phosphatase [Acidobacteriota bacterium]
RSGVMAAIILDCLGVHHDLIARDYADSAPYVEELLIRLRRDERYAETIAQTPAERLSARAETMTQFLERARRDYGGLAAWAQYAGLSPSELRSMRQNLLEP